MQLLGWTVFLDIREDEFVEERKRHALYLLQNRVALVASGADLACLSARTPDTVSPVLEDFREAAEASGLSYRTRHSVGVDSEPY
jgi:hypothetical protein